VNNSRRLSSPKPKSNINSEQPIVDIKSLVDAQNRTTFAVRSLALYLFISLQSALFGGGMIGLAINNTSNYDEYGALNSGASFFVTLGALIVFAGFVVSIVVGRWELDKSKVSSRSSQY
jgi:ABC-type xylose transport system permease subunit